MEQKNKPNKIIILGLAIIVAIWGISMISKSNIKPADEKTVEAESTPTEAPSVVEITDVKNGQIAIEAGSFYYKPNIIRVKKGETVKLTLNSVDMVHNFNIDELDISIPVTKSGDSSTVEFTPDQVGEFEFYCSIGSHRALGQTGKLIVVE